MPERTEMIPALAVFENETGDTWWIPGHHTDDEALAAVRAYVERNGSDGYDLAELSVVRGYWRDAHDPATDEHWERCEGGSEGAEPFTRVDA